MLNRPINSFAPHLRPRGVVNILVSACVFASMLAAFTTPSVAQVKWQMITEYAETNISGVGLTTFGKQVAAKTNGYVTTVNSFDNTMKITSGEMLAAAKELRIVGGDAFAGPLEATDIIFGLPSLPFAVQSVEAAKAVGLRMRGLYEKALAARGMKLLYSTIWPASGLWSDRPIKNADDLRGMGIRAYDKSSEEVMRAAGARAELLPFNDAIARVKDHKLNAILSSGDGGAGRKLWEDLRYFTAINYSVPVSIAFIRADAFETLPKEVQAQVEAAAAETERMQVETLSQRIVANYKQMRDNGVVIEDPARPEIIAALRAAAREPIASWEAKAGSQATEIAEWAMRQ